MVDFLFVAPFFLSRTDIAEQKYFDVIYRLTDVSMMFSFAVLVVLVVSQSRAVSFN
jgi:hypothetical protein